jgi:hypothetical protein
VRAAANRLTTRVEHWTAKRWSLPAEGAAGPDGVAATRAETVHSLVQRLADLAAGIEGRVPQRVPRLANDLALQDQVRVMVADLQFVASDDVLRAAAADIEATSAQL